MGKSDELLMQQNSTAELQPKDAMYIFGPCSAESRDQVLSTARGIAQHFPGALFRSGIWKPRSRPGAFEGIGEAGLTWLNEVKTETGLEPITEVATPAHVEAILRHNIKYVWIGARTSVNPFSVQELSDSLRGTGITAFVKNPVNPDLALWIGAIERLMGAGLKDVHAIHRGFYAHESAPFRNAPRWELVIDLKTALPDLKVICDASHISGNPKLIADVAQKSVDLDFQGLMIETHINPQAALSDAFQQVTPDRLFEIICSLKFRSASSSDHQAIDKLTELRNRVDATDDAIIQALLSRMSLIRQIGLHKLKNEMTIFQLQRWEEILQRTSLAAEASGLSAEFVKCLWEVIHNESIRIQHDLFNISESS
ncbi:MAG: chorismate mutase [Bacteroidia bacterium]